VKGSTRTLLRKSEEVGIEANMDNRSKIVIIHLNPEPNPPQTINWNPIFANIIKTESVYKSN
jgi:hypothetical protein